MRTLAVLILAGGIISPSASTPTDVHVQIPPTVCMLQFEGVASTVTTITMNYTYSDGQAVTKQVGRYDEACWHEDNGDVSCVEARKLTAYLRAAARRHTANRKWTE